MMSLRVFQEQSPVTRGDLILFWVCNDIWVNVLRELQGAAQGMLRKGRAGGGGRIARFERVTE
jgi:hypothetical protein